MKNKNNNSELTELEKSELMVEILEMMDFLKNEIKRLGYNGVIKK